MKVVPVLLSLWLLDNPIERLIVLVEVVNLRGKVVAGFESINVTVDDKLWLLAWLDDLVEQLFGIIDIEDKPDGDGLEDEDEDEDELIQLPLVVVNASAVVNCCFPCCCWW